MAYEDKRRPDHINRNALDNRKSNLRVSTSRENAWNSKLNTSNKTGYRGVFKYAEDRYWATIRTQEGVVYLGSFSDPISAAKAFDIAAVKYRGELAVLNFPFCE
jgi:hypothetical protein